MLMKSDSYRDGGSLGQNDEDLATANFLTTKGDESDKKYLNGKN